MEVTCGHCGRSLRLPPEKVPDRPFSVTCPGCRQKIRVDPTAAPEAAGGEALEPLHPLLPHERELLEAVTPVAFRIAASGELGDRLDAVLEAVGMREIERFSDVASAVEALGETEAGLLLIEMAKAPPPPCPPLEPVERLSPAVRRRTFVALVAENVRSLDGQVAFYLQVNCVLASRDWPRLPALLRRALLYHLRLYRYWEGR